MDKQEFKERLSRLGERYQEKLEELKQEGFKKWVEWETIRKLYVYLYNKGIIIETSIMEYNSFYSCVIIESFDSNYNDKTISVVIITPEDTEGSSYGKVDRIIIPEYKKYLEEEENKKDE